MIADVGWTAVTGWHSKDYIKFIGFNIWKCISICDFSISDISILNGHVQRTASIFIGFNIWKCMSIICKCCKSLAESSTSRHYTYFFQIWNWTGCPETWQPVQSFDSLSVSIPTLILPSFIPYTLHFPFIPYFSLYLILYLSHSSLITNLNNIKLRFWIIVV